MRYPPPPTTTAGSCHSGVWPFLCPPPPPSSSRLCRHRGPSTRAVRLDCTHRAQPPPELRVLRRSGPAAGALGASGSGAPRHFGVGRGPGRRGPPEDYCGYAPAPSHPLPCHWGGGGGAPPYARTEPSAERSVTAKERGRGRGE